MLSTIPVSTFSIKIFVYSKVSPVSTFSRTLLAAVVQNPSPPSTLLEPFAFPRGRRARRREGGVDAGRGQLRRPGAGRQQHVGIDGRRRYPSAAAETAAAWRGGAPNDDGRARRRRRRAAALRGVPRGLRRR
jgi:hypothetical protein